MSIKMAVNKGSSKFIKIQDYATQPMTIQLTKVKRYMAL